MQLPPGNPNPHSLPPAFYLYNHCCCGSQLLVLQFWFILKSSFLFPLISSLFFIIMLTHLDLVVFYFHSVLLAAYALEDDTCVCLCVCLWVHTLPVQGLLVWICAWRTYVCVHLSMHISDLFICSASLYQSKYLSETPFHLFPTFQSLFYLLFFFPHTCLFPLSLLPRPSHQSLHCLFLIFYFKMNELKEIEKDSNANTRHCSATMAD